MHNYFMEGNLCVVEANGLDYNIVVHEFELQSRYYVIFWIINLGKGMNSFILLRLTW